MAANSSALADEDGSFSDWIEIYNPDAAAVDLNGWCLTDSASNKTKWRFPAVTLPPGGYLVVFASNKDRREPSAPLHTNFALSQSGEYLGLLRPDGAVASEFAPAFPPQRDNQSYGTVALADSAFASGFLRSPTPGAPNSELDGQAADVRETVTFSRAAGLFSNPITVTLSGAGAGQVIRYVVATGPGAAEAEVTADSPVYSAPLTLAATALVRAAVFAGDTAQHGPVTSAHYLRLGASLADFRSRLPVLVIDDLGAGGLVKDGVDHASWLYGYAAEGNNVRVFRDAADFGTASVIGVRGSSSADFPKKGYNVKLRDAQGGKRAAPLFDLPAYERWALVAPWAFDQNYINNAFVYQLSNRIGRWAPRTRLVEAFFNAGGDALERDDYAGIYVVTDRIEPREGRVEIPALSPSDLTAPAITGGYILKIDPPQEDDLGWITEHGVPDDGAAVVIVSPSADDIAPAQLDYIRDYVQRMENALYADREGKWSQRTYLDFIDRASWVDHHLLNVFVSNPDALRRSAYFTKNRGGRLVAGPVWDFDRALGAYWDDRASVVDTWSGLGASVDVWRTGWWGVLAQDPEFQQDWIDRWQTLRRTELSNPSLTTLAQTLADSVGHEAAERDAARWPDDASPYGDYAAQIAHLKSWLTQRAEWIDGQFVAAPAVDTGGGLTFTPPPGAVLVYTLDGSDPRMLGGVVAPNAETTAEPLTVPASANVHVRSYDESRGGTFPGSAWSAAVGGPRSSPLAPAPRLANISARASVGLGAHELVTGLVVADTQGKRYLARAIGPGLVRFGAADAVPEPELSIVSAENVMLYANTGWQAQANAAEVAALTEAVGAFPLEDGSRDAAIAAELPAGAYTLRVAPGGGQPGVVLTELYELDARGRMSNLSTRAFVPAEGALTGGFVVRGPAHQRLLIRAVGPTLAALGTDGALADPVLTLNAGAARIAGNDRWADADRADAIATAAKHIGAFALENDSEDAALLITLAPGAYTIEVRGKDGAEGVALLEIYALP